MLCIGIGDLALTVSETPKGSSDPSVCDTGLNFKTFCAMVFSHQEMIVCIYSNVPFRLLLVFNCARKGHSIKS